MVGYHHCACRDCFDLYVGEAGEPCNACEDAGCDPSGCSECAVEPDYSDACDVCGPDGWDSACPEHGRTVEADTTDACDFWTTMPGSAPSYLGTRAEWERWDYPYTGPHAGWAVETVEPVKRYSREYRDGFRFVVSGWNRHAGEAFRWTVAAVDPAYYDLTQAYYRNACEPCSLCGKAL